MSRLWLGVMAVVILALPAAAARSPPPPPPVTGPYTAFACAVAPSDVRHPVCDTGKTIDAWSQAAQVIVNNEAYSVAPYYLWTTYNETQYWAAKGSQGPPPAAHGWDDYHCPPPPGDCMPR